MQKFVKITFLSLFIFVICFNHHGTAQSPNYERYLDQFIDPSVKPGDDFFQYSLGKWLKEHPIPANERAWGIGNVVREETYQRVQKINEQAASQQAAKGSNAQKIGDFWFSAMDTATIEKQGITALQPEFNRIATIHDTESLVDTLARLQYIGTVAMFSIAIFQDEMNSEKYALHLYQGGIGLPDRDYYSDSDERTKNIRSEYVTHLGKMFQLLGDDEAMNNRIFIFMELC
jgi:putative endopeptidase